jgi:hypothetical protein
MWLTLGDQARGRGAYPPAPRDDTLYTGIAVDLGQRFARHVSPQTTTVVQRQIDLRPHCPPA